MTTKTKKHRRVTPHQMQASTDRNEIRKCLK